MIIYFAVTNFKSFKKRVELSMIAGNYKRFPEHVYTGYSPNLLRSTALYGNNAAGKSNLIIAMEKLKDIVIGRLVVENEDDLPGFRLDDVSIDEPTVFEIEFLYQKKRYSYYLSFLKGKIIEEWLELVLDSSTNKTTPIFRRYIDEGKTVISMGQGKLGLKEKMRLEIYAEELQKKRNKPFLLDAFEKDIEGVYDAFTWFAIYLQIVRPDYYYPAKIPSFENKSYMKLAKQILVALNLGIDDLKVEKIKIDDFFGKSDEAIKKEIIESINEDNEPIEYKKNSRVYTIYKEGEDYYVTRLVTIHGSKSKDVQFDLDEESTGTQRIIEMLPSIISSIVTGAVYVFDEIEKSIHPSIIRKLLEIYLEAGSEFAGQIIFSTHECNLLDLNLLRQDEIWFAEKDNDGVSHIYSLSDFKPRFDKDIRKGYLEGQFSDMPFFTEPETLNWNGAKEAICRQKK